jgi:pyrroloquinoline quinone (PQQ) biosynthesis protein C
MEVNLTELTLKDLFGHLRSLLEDLAEGVKDVMNINERDASTERIERVMAHIRERSAKDAKEAGEDKEILKLLSLLSEDKHVLKLVVEETEEFDRFLNAIEKRMEMNKEAFGAKEKREYAEMREIIDELRKGIRK